MQQYVLHCACQHTFRAASLGAQRAELLLVPRQRLLQPMQLLQHARRARPEKLTTSSRPRCRSATAVPARGASPRAPAGPATQQAVNRPDSPFRQVPEGLGILRFVLASGVPTTGIDGVGVSGAGGAGGSLPAGASGSLERLRVERS